MTKQYFGKLTERQINLIQDAFDVVYETAPCHINALFRAEVMKTLKEDFIEAESCQEPTLENKFVETVKIQH